MYKKESPEEPEALTSRFKVFKLKSNFVRSIWILIYLLSFFCLGFYIYEIFRRFKFEPVITEQIGQTLQHEIPFPAFTICSPFFARNKTQNLRGFLKNPTQNLTVDEQNQMAANLQACAPHLGSKIAQSCPLADTSKIIEILRSRHSTPNDTFKFCTIGNSFTDCNKILNYVLTDYGFCFTFNLEGFPTLFNTDVISDDFKCYERKTIAQDCHFDQQKEYNMLINETTQPIEWTLEEGYKYKDRNTFPMRARLWDDFRLVISYIALDYDNLCPDVGNFYSIFLHMPNEILTPFHAPQYANKMKVNVLESKLYKTDKKLKIYPPSKRGCYFDGEKSLKFFKSYTKSHCEFECMANYTLNTCNCTKFSMPRENSTPICGLNQSSCYIKASKEWSQSSTCNCLHSCTYIEYSVKNQKSGTSKKRILSVFYNI